MSLGWSMLIGKSESARNALIFDRPTDRPLQRLWLVDFEPIPQLVSRTALAAVAE